MKGINSSPFNVDAAYAKLSTFPKIVINIAYYATAIFTANCFTQQVYEFLVRKFTVLDTTAETPQADAARKADDVAAQTLNEPKGKEPAPNPIMPNIVPPPAKPVDTSDFTEHLEREFWEWIYSSKEIQRNFQIFLSFNGDQPQAIADAFVGMFLEARKNREIIDGEGRKALTNQLFKIINLALKDKPKIHIEEEVPVVEEKKLADGRIIQISPTIGDGSCGMHAIIGVVRDGYFRTQESAKEVREKFVQWIKDNNRFPEAIVGDYFRNFNLSPGGFKENKEVIELYNRYHRDFNQLTPAEQSARTDAFLREEAVRKAYYDNLSNTGVYLLQDELLLFAESVKMNVVLYQKGWGNDTGIHANEVILDPSYPTVGVYFNGVNHYSRAQIKPS